MSDSLIADMTRGTAISARCEAARELLRAAEWLLDVALDLRTDIPDEDDRDAESVCRAFNALRITCRNLPLENP